MNTKKRVTKKQMFKRQEHNWEDTVQRWHWQNLPRSLQENLPPPSFWLQKKTQIPFELKDSLKKTLLDSEVLSLLNKYKSTKNDFAYFFLHLLFLKNSPHRNESSQLTELKRKFMPKGERQKFVNKLSALIELIQTIPDLAQYARKIPEAEKYTPEASSKRDQQEMSIEMLARTLSWMEPMAIDAKDFLLRPPERKSKGGRPSYSFERYCVLSMRDFFAHRILNTKIIVNAPAVRLILKKLQITDHLKDFDEDDMTSRWMAEYPVIAPDFSQETDFSENTYTFGKAVLLPPYKPS